MTHLPSTHPPAPRRPRLAWILLAVCALQACDANHAQLGRERFEARDYHGAIEELTWALRDKPDDAESRLYLAKALSRTSRRFDAKVHLQDLRGNPAFRSAASQILVTILMAEPDLAAAAAIIAEEIAREPEDPGWIEARGIVALRQLDAEQKRYATALQQEIGDGAKWVMDRLVELSTVPNDEDVDKRLRGILHGLVTRDGLSDQQEFLQVANRIRTLGLQSQSDLLSAVQRDGSRFRALMELAKMALGRKDSAGAQKHLMALIRIDDATLPTTEEKIAYSAQHMRAVDLLSAHFEEVGKLAESVTLLEGEHAAGILEAPMMERLGRQYIALSRYEEAAALAAEIVERDPRNTWGSYIRGVIASHEGRDQDAVSHLNRAQVQLPSNPTINAALARALVKTGRDSQALQHFRIALASGLGNDIDLTLEYAETLARDTDPAQAAQYLEERLKSTFRNPASKEHQRIIDEARRLWLMAGFGASDLADARAALIANPESVFAKLAVARLEREHGLATLALPRCKEVTEEHPGLADGWLLLAQVLVDLAREDEAEPALAKASGLRPDDPNIPWLQGRMALKRAMLDEARRHLGRALEIAPDLPGPKLDLVELEIQAGRPDAARRHCDNLTALYPDDPLVHRAVGITLLELNDPGGAVGSLEKASAAMPEDEGIRIKLAIAKVRSGRVEEGGASLLAMATDRGAAKADRMRAAEALDAAGVFPAAAKAWTAVFEAATEESERARVSERIFWTRLAADDPTGALDELVRMRLSGRKLQSERAFVVAAERLGLDRAAALQADRLRSANAHDAESLMAAHRSHSRLGQWHKAIEDLADIGRLKPDLAAEIDIDRARALLGLGKLAEAGEAAARAASKDKAPPARLPGLRLDLAIAGSDKGAIETALREILAVAPGDVEARLAAARALASLGDVDKAAGVLRITPLRAPDRRGAMTAAAILVAARDLRGAAEVLDAAQDRTAAVPEARALIAAALGDEPAASTPMARMLVRLAKGDFEGASAASATLGEPESVKEQWRAIVGAVALRADQAASASADLAQARIFAMAGMFTERADATLRGFAEKSGTSLPFDLMRAWWKLGGGNAKAAADIVVPLLEAKGSTAMVLLVAALAGAELAGEGSPVQVLEGATPPVPEAFVRDLFHALAARGLHGAALRAASRLSTPDERDRALQLMLAVERRDLKEARRLVGTLDASWSTKPATRAAVLWTALQIEETRAAAAKDLDAVAQNPLELDRLDLPTLYEAALLAVRSAAASAILDHASRKARFDAEAIDLLADVLRRVQVDKAALQTLEERLSVVDSTGRLRKGAPRPLGVD